MQAALLKAGKVERGFAKSLAWNGAGVDATAAQVRGALNDRHALAEIGGLGAGLFAARATSDDDKLVGIVQGHKKSLSTLCDPHRPRFQIGLLRRNRN